MSKTATVPRLRFKLNRSNPNAELVPPAGLPAPPAVREAGRRVEKALAAWKDRRRELDEANAHFERVLLADPAAPALLQRASVLAASTPRGHGRRFEAEQFHRRQAILELSDGNSELGQAQDQITRAQTLEVRAAAEWENAYEGLASAIVHVKERWLADLRDTKQGILDEWQPKLEQARAELEKADHLDNLAAGIADVHEGSMLDHVRLSAVQGPARASW
jgi:hypothetical protein